MAKTTTTLASNLGPSDWQLLLANKVGLNPGDDIVVTGVNETIKCIAPGPVNQPAIVYRGHRGTNGGGPGTPVGATSASGATVNFGPPTDWGVGVGFTSFEQQELQPYLEQVQAKHQADDEKAAEELKKKADEEAAKEAEKAAKAAKAAEKASEKDAEAAKANHPASHTAHK